MNIRLNKEKSIGKVLYIVEGGKTEPYRRECRETGKQPHPDVIVQPNI